MEVCGSHSMMVTRLDNIEKNSDYHAASINACMAKIDVISDGVNEIKVELIGDFEKKGKLTILSDACNKMESHVEEAKLIRPDIKRNSRVCKNIEDGMKLTWRTIVSGFAKMIPPAVCLWVLWLVSNKK